MCIRDSIKDVLLVGGDSYRTAMRPVIAQLVADGVIQADAAVNETTGDYLRIRKQLNDWVKSIGQLTPEAREKAVKAELKKATRFLSGASAKTDLNTAAMMGRPLGVVIGNVSETTKDDESGMELLAHAILHLKAPVFIDSGAFSEKPNFGEVLAKYDRLNDLIDKQNEVEADYPAPILMAPDNPKDQAETLSLLVKHANWLKAETWGKRNRIMVGLPKGELSLIDAYTKAVEAIGSDNFIVGIPSHPSIPEGAAWTQEELTQFLSTVKPKAVHFLGAGSDKTLRARVEAVVDAGLSGKVEVLADSASTIRNNVAKQQKSLEQPKSANQDKAQAKSKKNLFPGDRAEAVKRATVDESDPEWRRTWSSDGEQALLFQRQLGSLDTLSVQRLEQLSEQLSEQYVAGNMTTDELWDRRSAITAALIQAKKREDAQATPTRVEVFPGFMEIPEGTRIKGKHGLSIPPGSMGTVVGSKMMRFGRELMSLPLVKFDQADTFADTPRKMLPSDIEEVFAPRRVLFKRAPATNTPAFQEWFKDSKAVVQPLSEGERAKLADFRKRVGPSHADYVDALTNGWLSPADQVLAEEVWKKRGLNYRDQHGGEPAVWYHGTARDITEFRPKQADAIFVTQSPAFAEGFADSSEFYALNNMDEVLTPEAWEKAYKDAADRIQREYPEDPEIQFSLLDELNTAYAAKRLYAAGEVGDYLREALQAHLPAARNIMPLYVSAQKPFDYEDEQQVLTLGRAIMASGDSAQLPGEWLKDIRKGSWTIIEAPLTQRVLKELGHDGFYVTEGGQKNLAVYKSSQVKSVTGNRGTYSSDSPDIRMQRNATKLTTRQEVRDMVRTGKLPHMHLPDALERLDFGRAYMLSKTQAERQKLVRRWGDGLIKRFADSLIEVRRWIEDMPLPSAYLKQQLAGALYRSSTIRSALEAEVKQRYAERAFKAVTKTAKVTGMDADLVKKMVGTWMTAVYAPKANTYLISKDRAALIAAQRTGDPAAIAKAQQDLADRIADINQPAGFNGTFKRGAAGGLSNADAAQLVSEIEAQIDPQLLRDIAAPIYEMMAWKRAEDIKSGKVTRAMVASWPNHPDYVPLTGDPRYNPETDDAFHAGNHLNQDKDYAINGRKDSVADDAFDAAFAAVAKSINFASIQPFKKHLAAAYDEAQQRGIDIGLTREAVTGMTRLGDDVVIYRDAYTLPNGQQKLVSYAFRFADERVIKSLKRENEESANRFLTVLATPTRWYARFVTQMTATFAPINFVRDVWERSEFLRTRTLVKSNGQPVDVKAAARMSIAESMNPKVMRAAFASSFKTGAMTPERADLEQFIRLGGSSTLGDALPRTASTLERDIRRMMPGALDKVTGGNWSKAGDKAMWLIEGYNNGFELIPAFATFRALKAQGMTAEDAASAVLDLMNFRKKGTYMPAIRALYVFAQPAATSGYNLIQALSTKTGQKRFLAYAMTGALVYAFLRGLVWDDEDEEVIGNKLDNLSNFTVERTIPIRIGDTVVKLPIGFGMPQLAWSLAVNSNRVASGRYTLGEAVAEQIKGGVKSMAPVAPSEMELMERPVDFMVQTITPTLLRPIFNVYADQTAFGQRLTPAFKDPDKLKAETFRRSVPPQFVEAAQWMHDTLGLDVYPDHLKAISDGYLIGPARVLMTQLVDNPGKVFRGEPEKWAVLGSIVDNINDRQLINSVYYRIRGDLEEVNREYEYRAREGKLAGWMTPDRMKDVQAFKQFEASEKALSRPRASAYKARGVVPDAALSPTVQAIESQSDLMHKQLIQQYLKGK